jgi:F0F1-type ATP synthase membrane subunit b/b'
MKKQRFLAVCLGALMTLAGLAIAQPKRNVSAARHPHIAKAQALAHQAWEQVSDAQQANEWDMAGHAAKAKELLDQVNNELKMAAEAANKK